MFRLAKITNTASGAPECIKLPAADEAAHYGAAVKLESGRLVRAQGDDYPSYVVCGTADKTTATVFPVTESITLKTRLEAEDASLVSIGDRLAITENDTVTPSATGMGILYGFDGEFVYVKFIK